MARSAEAATDLLDDARFAEMRRIVREAGALTMQHFQEGRRIAGRVDWKEGGSPVTEVDFAVDRFLQEKLCALLPDAGWLSEETADTPDRLSKRAVLVVDPIDGTRGFMEGDARFAVSVALVVDGRPVVAVMDAPALAQTFTARTARGAFINDTPIHASHLEQLEGARVVGPRFLIDPVARALRMAAQPKVPSLALRFAQVASGTFDVAIASVDAHDWDIAAADLILHEAGAMLRTMDGETPAYNRDQTKHGILIAAVEAFHVPLRDAITDVTANWRKNKRN